LPKKKIFHPSGRNTPPITLNLQPLDNPAMHKVFLDDFVDIFPVNIGIPDTFRVDHDDRPFITAIKTPRRIDPYATLVRKAQRFALLLGVIAHGQRIKSLAAGTAIRTRIDAEENMITIIVHGLKDTDSAVPCKAHDRTIA
jgi:hypothetical protein